MNKRWRIIVVITILGLIIGSTTAYLLMKKSESRQDIPLPSLQKEITLADMQNHANETSCWTYIGGQVFDATTVIRDFPDYKTILLSTCGTDGSDVFVVKKYETQQLTKETLTQLRQALNNHQIGLLIP